MDCSKCVFSENVVSSGGPWGGPLRCSTNRLETFIEKGKVKHENGTYQLTQFCNMHRDQEWAEENKDKDLIQQAGNEVKCSFGIVIYADSSDKDKVNKTIQSIKDINYNKKKFGIVLSVNQAEVDNVLFFVDIAQKMQQEGYFCRFTMHSYDDRPDFREWECFMKVAQAGYISKIKSGQCIHPNTFNIIDEAVNHKLTQLAIFDDTKNDIAIINKSIASHHYLNHNNFEAMINDVRTHAQKDNLYLKI